MRTDPNRVFATAFFAKIFLKISPLPLQWMAFAGKIGNSCVVSSPKIQTFSLKGFLWSFRFCCFPHCWEFCLAHSRITLRLRGHGPPDGKIHGVPPAGHPLGGTGSRSSDGLGCGKRRHVLDGESGYVRFSLNWRWRRLRSGFFKSP